MTLRELAESASEAVLQRVGRAYGRVQESTPLETDLLESDDELVVVFDAPGVRSSDVQVKYVDHRVLVRVDRFREYREGYEMIFPGRGLALDGDVALPEDVTVDPDGASATLTERGTLEVRLPKREADGEHGRDRSADVEFDDTSEDETEHSSGDGADPETDEADTEETDADADSEDEGSDDEEASE